MERVSHISQAYPDRVEVRGRDLTGDLMGRLSFTEYFHLLLTGSEPTEDQRYFLDLLLVAIAEHGMMPTNVAARMTLAADPGLAAGRGRGRDPRLRPGDPGHGRGVRAAARRGAGARRRARRGGGEIARELHAAGGRAARLRAPGAQAARPARRAHPRARRRARRQRRARGARPRSFRDAVAEAWGKPLTMNVSMPIAAVMLDLGFAADAVKSVPILARTAGLLAHLAEEREQPIGFLMAAAAEEAIEYEPPPG